MTGLEGVAGRVTAVTGFEKGSGKTTFLNALLPVARKAGPVAVFSIGVDGASKARDGARAPEVLVEEGDVVLTTDLFARSLVGAARGSRDPAGPVRPGAAPPRAGRSGGAA